MPARVELGRNHLTSSVAFSPFPRRMLPGEAGLGRKTDVTLMPALRRQEKEEFKDSLGFIVKLSNLPLPP